MTRIDVAPNAFPKIDAHLSADGTAKVFFSGTPHDVEADSLDKARAEVLALVAQTAVSVNRPVRMNTFGPDGEWPLIVHPDGTVAEDDSQPARPAPVFEEIPPVDASADSRVWTGQSAPVHPTAAAPTETTRREARQSFLTQEQIEEPATQGWRGR